MPHITFFPASGPPRPIPHGGSILNPGEGGGSLAGPIPVSGGGGGGGVLQNVSLPCALLPEGSKARIACEFAQGFLPDKTDCSPGFEKVQGICMPIQGNGIDPTPGIDTPAERGPGGATGLAAPSAVCVNTLVCPTFADGKRGILWMNALTGAVVCLPRGTSGRGFGFIRKNKPRAKPPMSAADFRQLKRNKRLAEKAKKLAMDSGFTCKKR